MNKLETMGSGVPLQETPNNKIEKGQSSSEEKEEEQNLKQGSVENLAAEQKKQDENKIAEIRASLGIENPEEEQQLQKTLANAEALISKYEVLTKEVRMTGKSSDPEYSTKREALQEEMTNLSAELSNKFGINLRDVFVTDKEIFNKGREVVMLQKACGIFKEAEELQFSKEGTDEELIDEAKRLIEDYETFTEPMRKTGKSDVPNYSTRREAKQLLIESLAKELAKRLDSGDGIDLRSIRELSEKTGVDFSRAVRESYKLPPRKKEEQPEGRMPEIGTSGIWKTSGGDIEGRVIAGRKGGPYTIETPKGKMQVDNIF